jgi:hypothetical protein
MVIASASGPEDHGFKSRRGINRFMYVYESRVMPFVPLQNGHGVSLRARGSWVQISPGYKVRQIYVYESRVMACVPLQNDLCAACICTEAFKFRMALVLVTVDSS